MCFFECSTTMDTRIMKSIFMTRLHISMLSPGSSENGSVMHIQNMNIANISDAGAMTLFLRSFERNMPRSVAMAIAAASGRFDADQLYRCRFMMLSSVQPM